MKLASALKINADQMRIRSFEVNGQQFKVRVPLTIEAEALYEKIKNPDPELVEKYYKELSDPIISKKSAIKKESEEIKFEENDVIVGKTSIRQLAIDQASSEIRIVETIKLLVPADGTNLKDLTYAEVQEDLPLPIQISIVKKITEIISPNYEENQKN